MLHKMILKHVLRKSLGSVKVIQKFIQSYHKSLSTKYRTYIAIKIQWNAKGFVGDKSIHVSSFV